MNELHVFKAPLLLYIIIGDLNFCRLLNLNQQQGGLYGNEKSYFDRR